MYVIQSLFFRNSLYIQVVILPLQLVATPSNSHPPLASPLQRQSPHQQQPQRSKSLPRWHRWMLMNRWGMERSRLRPPLIPRLMLVSCAKPWKDLVSECVWIIVHVWACACVCHVWVCVCVCAWNFCTCKLLKCTIHNKCFHYLLECRCVKSCCAHEWMHSFGL